ncbi:pyridoxal phosphate-dependent decarboxylase family protein [Micromonospora globbae]|uniref:pyridoxal phosphate-dependent decarboxylase family protein n=1 Tax=Micromonospora globbae TaxID=1894969 RepID=UPI003443D9C8
MNQRSDESHRDRSDLRALLVRAAEHAAAFHASLPDRPVRPQADLDTLRKAFGGPLPSDPTPPDEVLAALVAAAEPGLMGSPGPRFFGFVVGGTLPAAMAADMLAVGWDQNAFNAALGPAGIAAEEAAGAWLKELLTLPASASVGFVTGAQAANTVGLVTARHHVLAQAGWDVERRGLGGAPEIRVVVGEERHATIDRSVRLIGIGTDAVTTVRTDRNGAIDVADLERVLASGGGRPSIVCLQAGNVNTGACDDLRAAIRLTHRHGGWVHVDGAFGLWAAASPAKRHLVAGIELADSWACDAHKWLNVPYDSAFAITSRPDAHAAAMSYSAPYLTGAGATVGGADYTAESSRRSRGFAVWAALRELGRDGVAGLVERCCALAERFADGMRAAGFEVVNDVVLNQVLVGFGDDTRTDEIVAAVQRDGTCWLGATSWRGRRLMRISVSNHLTTEADVDRSVAAITRIARSVL